MGLKVNNSSDSSFVSKYFSGIENFQIKVFSPSKAQAKEILGIEKKDEPNYISEKDGNKQVRIEVWLDNADTTKSCRFPHSFFLTNKEVLTKDGLKREVINKYGSTVYMPIDGEVPENMQWYEYVDVRPCVEGEAEFTAFIKNYINHNSKAKDECQLDIQAFFKGDFSQLNSILSANKVKVACGIKQSTDNDGKIRYQQVAYTRVTERPYGKGDKIQESINESKAGNYLGSIYFGEPDYTFTEVADPSKLAFFSVDKPEDLANKNTASAF